MMPRPNVNESCSPHVPRSSCDERLNPSIAPTSSNTITGRARNDRTLNAMLPSDAMMLPNSPIRSRITSRTIATTVASTAHSNSRPVRERAPAKAEPSVGSAPSMRCPAPDTTAACPITDTQVARRAATASTIHAAQLMASSSPPSSATPGTATTAKTTSEAMPAMIGMATSSRSCDNTVQDAFASRHPFLMRSTPRVSLTRVAESRTEAFHAAISAAMSDRPPTRETLARPVTAAAPAATGRGSDP